MSNDSEKLAELLGRLKWNPKGPANVTQAKHLVTRDDRAIASGDRSKFLGCTIWFTGLSGSGKSSIAFSLERRLVSLGIQSYTLDGDNIRLGLNSDLRFSPSDRAENIRRVAEVAKLFADSGTCVITSFISPYERERQLARKIHEEADLPFLLVHLSTPLAVCEARDTKQLYARARRGEITDFTGISSAYEVPGQPDLRIDTSSLNVEECVDAIVKLLVTREIIPDHLIEDSVNELFVPAADLKLYTFRAAKYTALEITDLDLQWVQVLAEGWASPLRGFMREAQYLQCLYFGGLVEGRHEFCNLSVPIVLPVESADKERLCGEHHLTLTHRGKAVAVLENIEFYAHRKEERCCRIFGICDRGHPVIDQIMASGDWLVGGDLLVLQPIVWNDGLDEFRLTPRQLRSRFKKIGADCVFAFQLRNPIHNGHALLMRETRRKLMEERGFSSPLLLLHPLGGWTKSDDVPLDVRVRQHRVCLEEDGILDKETTLLAIFPSPMLYAGPREVQWHARCRLVAGAQFFIVGRDPAGLSHPSKPGIDLYEPTHGGKVLSAAPGLRGLEIVPFRVAAYNKIRGAMEIYDPKRKDDFIFISGTKMRTMAKNGEQPPNGFMGPSAWKIICEYYLSLEKKEKKKKEKVGGDGVEEDGQMTPKAVEEEPASEGDDKAAASSSCSLHK